MNNKPYPCGPQAADNLAVPVVGRHGQQARWARPPAFSLWAAEGKYLGSK